MGKRVPQFKTDEEAEKFLEQGLTDYPDPEHMIPLRFEFKPKDSQLNLRLAQGLLQAIKARAAAEGLIHMTPEHTVSRSGKD